MKFSRDSLPVRIAAACVTGCIRFGTWIATRAGYDRTLACGDPAGDVLYRLLRRPRMRIHHNLRLAFGDNITEQERNRVARQVLRYFAKNWLELFFYGGSNKKDLIGRVTIEGLENLEQALAKGKGVIAVSGHIGNYPLLGTQFTERGYDFTVVIRDPKNPVTSLFYEEARTMIRLHSLYTTPERQFYKSAVKILSRNGILCLISDENKRTGGVFVDFFGRPASTPPGPAALALRTGAALVPIFIMRKADNSQRIIIEQEIARESTGDDERDVRELTAQYTAVIEGCIRRDLGQWMWTNFRWRTQPWGKSDEAKLKKFQPVKRLRKKLRRLC